MEGDLKGQIIREWDTAKGDLTGTWQPTTVMQFVIVREGTPERRFGPFQADLPAGATNDQRQSIIDERIRGLRGLV